LLLLVVVPSWPPTTVWSASGRDLDLATQAAVFAVLAICTARFAHWTGLPTMATPGLWAVGSYTSAILIDRHGLTFWSSLAVAMVVTAAIALPIGLISLRTRGLSFLVVTLAFSEFIGLVARSATGLTDGVAGIPVFGFPPGVNSARAQFFLFVAILAVEIVALWALGRSRLVANVQAARDNESLTQSLGVNVMWSRLAVFVLTAALIAPAGPMFLYQQQAITPQVFSTTKFLDVYLMVILGGAAGLIGPAVGSWFVTFLPSWTASLGLDDANVRQLVFGVVAVAGIFLARDGLSGLLGLNAEATTAHAVPDSAGVSSVAAGDAALVERATAPMSEPRTVLTARGMSKSYGANQALADVDIDLQAGTIRGLIGPNGCGKSTLLNCLSGFVPASGGIVALHGKNMSRVASHRRVRHGLARTFQEPRGFPSLTVSEGFGFAVLCADAANRHRSSSGRSNSAHVESLLRETGLVAEAHTSMASLSYGDLRIATVAMAMAMRPDVLLLDEPAAGLSAPDAERLSLMLLQARREGCATLLVSHEMDFLLPLCDQITVLDAGVKVVEGDPETVCQDPRVVAAYLGRPVVGHDPLGSVPS
jgi:ABC-type branched-subunit amino acid transport system ATPase component/ABC-type branched-subunit amino acid transport system permease subunit